MDLPPLAVSCRPARGMPAVVAVGLALWGAVLAHGSEALAVGEETAASPAQVPVRPVVPRPDAADPMDYVTPRYEPAGFPIIGGNSDTGVMFGLAGTITRFSADVRPYRWNMDLVLSASVKDGPDGPELTQHDLLWQIDVPGLLGGRLRLNPVLSIRHVINEGYFGLGNASVAERPPNAAGEPGRYFQSIVTEARARLLGRITLTGPLSAMFVGGYRYVSPATYNGSRLALDGADNRPDGQPTIRGLQPLSLLDLSAGIIYDTRDSEILPTRGMMHQAAVRVVQGLPLDADVRYTDVSVSLAGYVPLGGPFVFAARLVGDVEVGNVPFYDLYTGGPFAPTEMPGGSAGVRGVPLGRYLGPVKFVANLEIRTMLGSFTLVGQHFRVGTNVFFDTGRVWSDLTFNNPLDGTGIGLKYGAGAGIYLRWGQAAIFRIEAAYSPDAAAENPNFPVGIYVADGVMF